MDPMLYFAASPPRQGMAGESMSYPLKYGYSLVGRVAKCGGGVDPEKFLGKLVFAFSPHSTWVVADADGVMLVPEVTGHFVLFRRWGGVGG